MNAGRLKVAGVLAIVAGCDSGGTMAPPTAIPVSVVVAPDSAALTYLGETVRFTARVAGGTGSAGGTVRWESTDQTVVTVDGSGLVTARGNGTAEVRASAGGASDAAPVRVEQRVAALAAFGDGQRALPGLSLPGTVGVQVQDAGGRAMVGVDVRFAVAAGGGAVNPESVVSDGTGVASAVWTVGATIGEQRLTASVAGGLEAEITARAVGPDSVVARIELHQGGGGAAGRTRSVGVRLVDGAGRPVAGALATFLPSPGDGSVDPDSVRSDSLGRARTRWSLGAALRDYALLVSSANARLEVVATLLAPATKVRTIELQSRGGSRAGMGQALPVEVRLRDVSGYPVAGALVTFTAGASGGSVNPDSARSDDSGFSSSVWRLGRTVGDYTLVVASGDARLELVMSALDPDSVVASVALWSGDRQWGVVGQSLHEPVVVQAQDEAGDPVPGALVTFVPQVGGGSVVPESLRSDSLGRASAEWTLGPEQGDQTLAASVVNGASLAVAATARPDAGVCGRTRAVIEAILKWPGIASCADVTEDQLAAIVTLSLSFAHTRVPGLRNGDFAGLPGLKNLYFVNNGLSALPPDIFAGLDSLRFLSLWGNRLESLPAGTLAGTPNLEELHLTSNRLTEIPPDVASLKRLTNISLAGNPLQEVPPGSFAKLGRLRRLDLSFTELRSLDSGTFKGLAELELLALSGNRLARLPPGIFNDLQSLRTLVLHSNQLAELSADVFASLTQLSRLYLGENDLDRLAEDVLGGLSDLTHLQLHKNGLTELPPDIFAGMPILEHLRLGDNQLEALPPELFASSSSLEYLSLANNRLASLPPQLFEGLERLGTLRLEQNALASLPPSLFGGLSGLTRLDLVGNQLAALPAGIFEGLAALAELRLIGNELTELPPGAFRGLSSLERLDLRANPGDPFPVVLELARTDAADLLAPGPASVTLRVPIGAPLSLDMAVSVQGGSASSGSFGVPAGDSSSAVLEVIRIAGRSGAVHVSLGPVPAFPIEVRGLEYVVGGQMVLFAPSVNRSPVVAKEVPPHWLQAGVRSTEVGLAGHFSDPDGDALVFTAASEAAEVVAVRVADGVLVLEPLSEGEAVVEVAAEDPGGLRATLGVPVVVTRAPDPDGYQIELIFGEGVTEAERFSEAEKVSVRRAAARWEEVVTGDQRDVPVDTDLCYDPGRIVGSIDDVVITMSISDAGPINSIGQAGPCVERESGLALIGAIWFNRQFYGPDAPETGPNSMYQVALHEMGHVLGIGSREKWHGMLRQPTLDVRLDTHFPGPLAVDAFNEAGGRPYTGGKVPVDNGVSVSPNTHWRRDVLRGELMSPAGGTLLSAITVQALADLGYDVDASRADPYTLPALDRAAAADAEESPFVGDVLKGPVFVVDENGKVVRIIRN
ncbi:leucine-rich repeat domain-containing protein [Candidatus Palauibacter sp.]|uniref:leucine-rich repeat domain-containing protein n=1 Tax=Candidatus Palauibacter sp. TaxID=3101350 RepID=UPI003B520236